MHTWGDQGRYEGADYDSRQRSQRFEWGGATEMPLTSRCAMADWRDAGEMLTKADLGEEA